MTVSAEPLPPRSRSLRLSPQDRPVAIAAGFVLVILAAGTAYTLATQGNATLLQPHYLLQQLQVASFLGMVATGMMLVILLGHIDLSVPWVIAVGGMMSTAATGWWGEAGVALAIPFGMVCGLAFGLFNGVGVAFLRIPSMIFTLGVNAVAQGLMVLHTGGFAPQDHATDLMHWLATRHTLGIPNALFVWLAVGLVDTAHVARDRP